MKTLREHRSARGMSIRDLARAAGVAPNTIIFAEQGRQVPRPDSMWRIAGALGTVPLAVAEFARAVTDPPPDRTDPA